MKEERAREIYNKVKEFAWDNNTETQEDFWRILLSETTEEEKHEIEVFIDNDFTKFMFKSETPDANDDSAYCLLEERDGILIYEFCLTPGIYWQNTQYLLRALGFDANVA